MTPPLDNRQCDSASKPWLRSLVYVVVTYLGFVLMLLFLENMLVYHPVSAERGWVAKPNGFTIDDVTLTTAGGTRIHAWWCPVEGADHAILYCHGNAGNLSHRGGSVVKLSKLLGASVLIIDYPGYGKSEGSPTEQGCYEAADAAYIWLNEEKQVPPKKILLYGASLGGGVVTDLATRKDHRALVLVKTFTSLPGVADDIYWWLPVPKRMLMRNQFDSMSKIASCRRPVFIAHGTADRLIPHHHGEKLAQAAREPKRFLSIAGADHNDSLSEEFFTSLKEFLRANPVDGP